MMYGDHLKGDAAIHAEMVATEIVDTGVADTDMAGTDMADTKMADTEIADTDMTDTDNTDIPAASPSSDVRAALHSSLAVSLLKSDIAATVAGKLKALINVNFLRVLSLHVKRKFIKLLSPELHPAPLVRSFFLSSMGNLVAKVILGKRGVASKEWDEEKTEEEIKDGGDEIDEDKFTIETFKSCLGRREASFGKQKKKLSPAERSILAQLKQIPSLEKLGSEFLPRYLTGMCNEWTSKLTANGYLDSVALVWRLFAETNSEEFVQQLLPQPSVKCTFMNLTGTRLAACFVDFVKSKDEATRNLIFEDLNTKIKGMELDDDRKVSVRYDLLCLDRAGKKNSKKVGVTESQYVTHVIHRKRW